ncbi:MAG: EAL domain-containing protein [Lachnospiraceae bacterium]|nr:EAL domain-containing protein [Lachnospiraceae bacterium]
MLNKLLGKENSLGHDENLRTNRLAFLSYVICYALLIILAPRTFNAFTSSENARGLIICTEVILISTLFICAIFYRRWVKLGILKNVLFLCFLVYYYYILFVLPVPMLCLIGAPFLVIASLYRRKDFSMMIALGIIVAAAADFFYDVFYLNASPIDFEIYLYSIMDLITIIILISIYTDFLENLDKRRRVLLEKERDRLRKLASVSVRRIFEYNLKNDSIMLARGEDGFYGRERFIDHFSQVAKTYRYVLLADWEILDEFIEACKRGDDLIDMQMRLRDKNADYKWYRIKGRTVKDAEGNPDYVIGTLTNIDEIKRIELRQADENKRDPLTKLYKAEFGRELMSEFLSSSDNRMHGEYAALLYLDIDGFEELNDRMGNTFGDEILKNIASELDSVFYSSDVLSRVGGDEFTILMKNIKSKDDIEKKIQEIRELISYTYVGENVSMGSTVGIGASIYPTDGTDYETLLLKAEKALFDAKRSGRNKYTFYDENREDIYSTYPIQEKHEKLSALYESGDLSYDKASDSLIELAFRLIDESKDTDSAINLLNRQMARRLNLGGIRIKARVGKEYRMINPYKYYVGEDMDLFDNDMEFSYEQWNDMLQEYRDGNGVLSYSSVADINGGTLRTTLIASGVKAYLGCAFYDKGEFAGNIEFIDFETEREWSPEEVTTIRAIANVVSSYLLKMKAYEDASDTVERLTGYDSITGLCKYEKFLNLISEYIENAPHGSYVVAYMDFSNFKYINETHGYEVGDRILKYLADACMDSPDFIYGSRVFSDNIVIVCSIKEATSDIMTARYEKFSEEFTAMVKKDFGISNVILDIGFCTFKVCGLPIPIKSIISNANMARKYAKMPDSPRVMMYDDEMGKELKAEIAYAADMESAFRNHEFVVYMQPKVDLRTGLIAGAEALIRWKKGDGTLIFPNDFIPVFEKNKSITLLDFYVYEEVCKYLKERLDAGKEVVRISINVSRVHLYSIDEFVNNLKNLLERYELDPKYLEFELTETVFTDRVEDTIELMSKLRELGVLVSMDDFGSGYSSLNVLTKLPLDVLKLDKEFLRDFDSDPDEKLIIPGIIDIAKKLNLKVVCEGVETREQVKFLREVGCDYAQGYYYSKPIPIPTFDGLLEIK